MLLARVVPAAALLVVCAGVASCDLPIALAGETNLSVDVPLPELAAPPGSPPLTADLEIPGLLAAPLRITDDNRAQGTFSFFVEEAGPVQGLLRVRGQLSSADDTATLVVADLNLDVGPGTETAVSVDGDAFTSAPTPERPWLDLNRNDVDNKDDFARGCDPAVPPSFLRVSETDLQLPQNDDRAVVVVDNLLPRPIRVDLSVVDAPGVGIDIVSADGDASSLAALSDLPPLAAGQSLIVAVSYAAVDAFFAQGVIVVSGTDDVDDGACGTVLRLPVRVFANVSGGPRPADPAQNIPAAEAAGGLDADAFTVVDGDRLASGLPLNVPLTAAPNGRRLALPGAAGSLAADAVFVVDTDEDTRLDVVISGAPFDVDLDIVDAATLAVIGDAAHAPKGSVESARLRNPNQLSGKVFIVVGVPGTTEPATLGDDEQRATVSLTVRASRAPRLATLPEPRRGPVEGGTVVAFAGEALDAAGAFFFGARRAACTVSAGADVDTVSCTAPPGTLNAGQNPVDIVYVSATTGERATLVDAFRYDPSTPRIDSVEPSVIVRGQPAALTLRGFGFVDPLDLTIGGVPVDASVIDDATVFAAAPDLAAGAYDVTVTVRGRDDATFSTTKTGGLLYLDAAVPPPQVTGVFPSSGDVAGGTTLNVSGSGFAAGARVFVGDDEADVIFVGATTIIASTPPGAPGLVAVRVVNPDLQESSLDDAFTFDVPAAAPPVIFALVPSTGSTAGGEEVTVLGAHFADDAAVTFGGAGAVIVSRSEGALVVVVPAASGGSAGLVDVVVDNVAAADSVTAADAYSYVAPVVLPPQVFSVSPAESPLAGGATVTVLGARFAAPAVTVGGVAVTLSSQSDNALVFAAPPAPGGVAGTGDVVVTNGDGQTARVQNAFSWRDDVVLVRDPTIADVSPDPLNGRVGGEELRLIGSDLDQTVGATVVSGSTRIPARVVSDSFSAVVVVVDAALPAGTVQVELVDAVLGAHLSPPVAVRDPVPVSLDVSGRADEDNDFTLIIGGADLNPGKLFGVRATPLDAGSGAEVVLTPSFAGAAIVAVDVAAGLLGRGGWVIALVYREPDGDSVVVPVDVLEVGGFCPGAALCDTCGNNVRDPGEDCDGTDFDGETCTSNGFSGGTLGCSGCQFDFNACAQCGNGLVEVGEQCDGANLNAQSCTSRGFTAGTLACGGTCLFDTTACRTCGDGVCSTGETSANCAADCPATCGNGSCNAAAPNLETCSSCPRDCGTCAPYALNLLSGGGQTTRITDDFDAPVRVRVVDDNGDPVRNVDVTFNPAAGDVVSAATRVTDNNGEAFVSWTPGPRVGDHALVVAATARDGAAITGQPVTITNRVDDVAAGTFVHVAGNLDASATAGAIGNRASIRTGLQQLSGIAVEPDGDLLLLDRARLTRLKMPEGVYEHVAGDAAGLQLAPSDQNDGDGGPATAARFVAAVDVAVDAAGVIYVADDAAPSDVIRRIATDGTITTVAGGAPANASPNDGDGGPAIGAHFTSIKGIDVDDDGNLVVSETSAAVPRLRRVLLQQANPTTTTVPLLPARIGTSTVSTPNGLLGHPVALPGGVVAAAITSNTLSNLIAIVGPSGLVAPVQTAAINAGLCRGSDGALYGGTNSSPRFFRNDGAGGSVVVAGTGTNGQVGDLGPASLAQIGQPGPCTGDAAGNIYFVDKGSGGNLSRVRMIRAGALSSPLAVSLRVKSGANQTGLAGGSLPAQVVFEVVSNVGGVVAALAGAPVGFRSSQPGTSAGGLILQSSAVGVATNPRLGRLVGPLGATAPAPITAFLVESLGELYPSTATAAATLRLPVSGESTTWLSGAARNFFAGATINTLGLDADGNNIFGNPWVSDDGRLVLASEADGGAANKLVMIVEADGTITRVAGGATVVGDGGPALGAQLSAPFTAAEDSAGNLYVADSSLRNIRIITPDGIINRYAGGGTLTTTPVDARSLQLSAPLRLAFEEDDDLVIGDTTGVFIVDGATRVARLVLPQVNNCGNGALGIAGNRALAVANRPNGGGAVVVGRVNNTGGCQLASGIYLFDVDNNQVVLPPALTLFAGATNDNVIAAAVDADDNVYWITENGSTRTLRRRSAAGVQSVIGGLTTPVGVAVDPNSGLVFVYDAVAGNDTNLRVLAP